MVILLMNSQLLRDLHKTYIRLSQSHQAEMESVLCYICFVIPQAMPDAENTSPLFSFVNPPAALATLSIYFGEHSFY